MSISSWMIILIMLISGLAWLYGYFTKSSKLTDYGSGIFLIFLIICLIKVFNIGILLILVILTFGSLFIWLGDHYCFKKKRMLAQQKEPALVEHARSLFPIFLIVLIVRSFICEPFVVPSGSLEPTILPGDYLIVNQFIYGLRLPVINTQILQVKKPKIGDIVVFHDPITSDKNLVKRVVGAPGDHVVYKDRVLYINGQMMQQTFIKNDMDIEPPEYGGNTPVKLYEENLVGIKHQILLFDENAKTTDFDVVVPKGYYFMMGDNRDNSADSRMWGFMPETAIIGKAWMIFFSWNDGIRWSRIGTKLV